MRSRIIHKEHLGIKFYLEELLINSLVKSDTFRYKGTVYVVETIHYDFDNSEKLIIVY